MPEFIPVANPSFTEAEAKAVYDTIKSGWISMGKKVSEVERKIANYTNTKYAVAMNNGTSSLDALLSVFNIKDTDEVLVPSLTYISTANVVMYKNANLFFGIHFFDCSVWRIL